MLLAIINFYKNTSIEIWIDYGKIVYFILVFWFLYFLLISIKDYMILISKIINTTFFIIFLVCIIQLFDPPFIGSIIKSMYGTIKLRTIWTEYPRIYGTFFNANWFGVYLVFYLTWLNSNLKNKKISVSRFILSIILLSMLFIISGSRTAIFGAMVSLFFQFIGRKQIKYIFIYSTIIIVMIITIGYFLSYTNLLDKTLNRFILTFNILTQEGLKMSKLNPGRWNSWIYTYNKFVDSPIIGTGYIGDYIPHNSYLYFLNMFGLVGAATTIIILLIIIYISKRQVLNSGQYDIITSWKRGFIPAFLAMSLAAEFLITTQVMLLIVLIYAIGMMLLQDKHKKLRNEVGD